MHYLIVSLFVMHWRSSEGWTLLLQSNIKTCTQVPSQRTTGIMSLLQMCVCKLWWCCGNWSCSSITMAGKKFTDTTLHHNDKVKTIGAKSNTVKVSGQNTLVNPSLLFNRITCVLNKVMRLTHSWLMNLLLSHFPFLIMVWCTNQKRGPLVSCWNHSFRSNPTFQKMASSF